MMFAPGQTPKITKTMSFWIFFFFILQNVAVFYGLFWEELNLFLFVSSFPLGKRQIEELNLFLFVSWLTVNLFNASFLRFFKKFVTFLPQPRSRHSGSTTTDSQPRSPSTLVTLVAAKFTVWNTSSGKVQRW